MLRRCVGTMLCCVALAGVARGGEPGVTIKRVGDKLSLVNLQTAKGSVRINRGLWRNTTVTTESGKSASIIDPFMYSTNARTPDGKATGGYWSKPEVFDTWQIEQVKDAKRPGAPIVAISARQPDAPVMKEAAIALDPDDNVAYVLSRLSALDDIHSISSDRQTIYLSKPAQDYTIIADGKEAVPASNKRVNVEQYMLFQHKRTQVSVGVVFLPKSVQKYPRAAKVPLGLIYFYINPEKKRDGADCFWHKGSGKMKKGDAWEQRYILVWGDGDLKEKVAELSKKALAGELNDKIPALP